MEIFNYSDFTQRNIGIISVSDQEKVRTSTIAIAGCGADGGAPAISLARLGVSNFRLADPDVFDYSNINRQEGAFTDTINTKKAREIELIIKKINPEANVTIYTEGINEDNVNEFIEGSDIVLDEIDYRKPKYALLLHIVARKLNIPVITTVSVGWNAFLFYFDPSGLTFEEYVKKEPLSVEDNFEVNPSAYAPELPSYISEELLKDILSEKVEIPVVDPAVRLASALASSFCIFWLTGAKKIMAVPHYYSAGDLLLKQESFNNLRRS